MTPHTDEQWTPQDDLEWAAFRYVSNEMSDDEIVAFEDQLADDQAAREAVACCVEMTHAIVAVAETEETHHVLTEPQTASRSQVVWKVLATAAAVVAVCSAYWIGQNRGTENSKVAGNDPETKVQPETGNPELVVAWLDADFDDKVVPEPAPDPESADPMNAESSEEGEFDWLVAAVDAGEASDPKRKESN